MLPPAGLSAVFRLAYFIALYPHSSRHVHLGRIGERYSPGTLNDGRGLRGTLRNVFKILFYTLEDAWEALAPERVFAFTTTASTSYADIEYRPDDVFMFGPESVGLPAEVQQDPHVSERVKIPMKPGRRSLNLANSASIAVFEAWRQNGFEGGAI